MTERTAQCQECTDVFACGPTGRFPKLCPSCRKAHTETVRPPAKARRKVAAPSDNGHASPAIVAAIEALREEIETLEGQLALRQQALGALEAVA